VISSSQRPLPDNTQHSQVRHPCPRWNSSPRSQQASGLRPTPQTARPLRPAYRIILFVNNGLLVNSTPTPSLSIYVHTSAAFRRVLNKLCDTPVGWSWPALNGSIRKCSIRNVSNTDIYADMLPLLDPVYIIRIRWRQFNTATCNKYMTKICTSFNKSTKREFRLSRNIYY